jgi:hypothetical protein
MKSLFRKNWNAAYAHIGSFLCVVLLFSYYDNSQKHAQALTFRYTVPKPDAPNVGQTPLGGTSCNSDGTVPATVSGQCSTRSIFAPPKKTWSFNVIYGCLAFFAITAFAHIFYATDGFNSGKYSSVVAQGWNPYRWVEYAASASIMTVLIAYTLGIRDSNHLTSLIFINVALQLCGFLVENALIQTSVNMTTVTGATVVGWTLLLGMWIPIIYAFWSLVNDINLNYKGVNDSGTGKPIKIPNFVWFIIVAQIINFWSFGFIQLGQVRDTMLGTAKPFEVYESRYIFLSFAGKLALGSGLAYGLIYRTRKC